MRKMSIILCLLVLWFSSGFAAPPFDLKQLQGAWWSDPGTTTADFAILEDKVWLDFDGEYHPCRIEGDILIFELPHGSVRNRIVSIEGDRMVLEYLQTKERTVLTRAK
jgi:hypothetical protein